MIIINQETQIHPATSTKNLSSIPLQKTNQENLETDKKITNPTY